MKRTTLIFAFLLLALARSAQADFSPTFSTGFQNGGVIPDGVLTGWSDTRTLSGAPTAIGDVNVRLSLSGGWNGDLYAYLVHNSGFAVLLNRVGRTGANEPGFGTAGMNVTLDDSALLNIHDVSAPGTPPTYSYAPDGRNISPLSSGSLFDSTSATALLSSFTGNANGNWTLFVADVSGGGVSTVTSWGLDIAAVPEPASIIEGMVAVLFLGGVVGLYRRKGAKAQPLPATGIASQPSALAA